MKNTGTSANAQTPIAQSVDQQQPRMTMAQLIERAKVCNRRSEEIIARIERIESSSND
jgi:hypothetical protein